MLKKRVIACLDVAGDKVVKGVKFKNHQTVGDILELSNEYNQKGIDELVFYDIKASPENRTVSPKLVEKIAKTLTIPFCVAGGIKTLEQAKSILYAGAEKVSVNSMAISKPELISDLSKEFGAQAITVGIDSHFDGEDYSVYQFTGCDKTISQTKLKTVEWVKTVESFGAGEIVLNCMNQDGARNGYDLVQLDKICKETRLPVVASGGAGCIQDFIDVFSKTNVSAALAASVFHFKKIEIRDLKQNLKQVNIPVRMI